MATHLETISGTDSGLRRLATDVVSRAMKRGASAAEAVVREGTEFSTAVRLGQVETLKESGSRAIGLRVFLGGERGGTHPPRPAGGGLEPAVSGAACSGKVTIQGPFRGVPYARR